MFKSDKLEKLPPALRALQADLKPIKKDAKSHNSKYATLAAVMEAIQPMLDKHGFSVVQCPLANGRGAALETILMHDSGEYIFCTIDVPLAKQNDPQAYGSGLTYGRRYSLMALLGLVTEDDDGRAAIITLQDRLDDFFSAENLADLDTVKRTHELANGLTRVEIMAMRAAFKVMHEALTRKQENL